MTTGGQRAVAALEVYGKRGRYLIFHNRASGKRRRYDVLRLGAGKAAIYKGRELSLGHARRICR